MEEKTTFDGSKEAILAAIPHRPPFLFVDEIREWSDEEIVCAYRFKEDEFFFAGHYPGAPIVPGVVLCEAAMQAGAIFTSRLIAKQEAENAENGGDGQTGEPGGELKPVVGRINDVKFKRIVRPGETVELRVSFKEKMAAAYFLRAKVYCEGKLAVSFEFAVTMAPAAV
ncbi:MAG: beta-hydroxyacyl-ACP dehydratase [Thermoguttaceae bacterium]|nr:beta-hydroxyacyl-ACP dehydratase [Thermoguttaceae bacterium]